MLQRSWWQKVIQNNHFYSGICAGEVFAAIIKILKRLSGCEQHVKSTEVKCLCSSPFHSGGWFAANDANTLSGFIEQFVFGLWRGEAAQNMYLSFILIHWIDTYSERGQSARLNLVKCMPFDEHRFRFTLIAHWSIALFGHFMKTQFSFYP